MAVFIYILLTYQRSVEVAAVLATILIFISSLDDLFIDVYYWIRAAYRWYWVDARQRPVDLEALLAVDEKPIAIMVPAWQEHDVIYHMLATNVGMQDYGQYRFFVGAYQNDALTQAEVRRAAEEFPAHVQMVVVPRDGPTSKADCLNAILADIAAFEAQSGLQFAGTALHDSEDIIHPFELKLFNYLLNRGEDFIQLPVYSFKRALGDVVAGTYMDEFAEWHSKDLVVRESVTGIVPCAGTSACFSRAAIAGLAGESRNSGEIFRLGSLTEDYDTAFRLSQLGMKEIFVRFPIRLTIEAPNDMGLPVKVEKRLPIATREFFPDEFRAAYRQRARWILGIVFQGWAQHGWRGGLGAKYFFMRDRKGVITAPVAIFCYFLLVNLVLLELVYLAMPVHMRMHFILLDTDWYRLLLVINLAFLLNRVVQRTYFTARIYGLAQGMVAGPRMVVSNFLNFFATMRAFALFTRHKITGKPIAWDKTAHNFPNQTMNAALMKSNI